MDEKTFMHLRKKLSEATGVSEEDLAKQIGENQSDRSYSSIKYLTEMLNHQLSKVKDKDELERYMVVVISLLLNQNMTKEEQEELLKKIGGQLNFLGKV